MFQRFMLWFWMNIAVIAVITIIFTILEKVFWFSLDLYWVNYTSIFVYSAIIWFTGSFISLVMSKWMAKRTYDMTFITFEDESSLNEKQRIVWNTVVELAERNNINIPEVWIYQSDEPNAFATWMSKNNSLVAVSTSLLDSMETDAIEWVVAHEMSHILNWDMVTMTLLQWVLNTFVIFLAKIVSNLINSRIEEGLWWIAYFIIDFILQILFWILASLIAMKFSRYREFKADEWSARFVGKDKMLAWLLALKQIQYTVWVTDDNLSSMKISSKSRFWLMSLFSSHPDLDDRIQNIKNLKIEF